MSNVPRTQELRFRKPTKPSTARSATIPKVNSSESDDGLKQKPNQQISGKTQKWCPSFSAAFRMLFLVRFCAAMYSNISDCDEVFNFWEPLHYALKNYGFQTWEVSPAFAIRSWAYIFLHYPPAVIGSFLTYGKRPSFFAVRATLGLACSLCEAQLFRSVVESLNERVGLYLFFMLLTSAGMWNASTAFLPSSFALYCNMLAFSFAIKPTRVRRPRTTDIRTLSATVMFGLGAIVGWPFSILASFPFVFEELFVYSGDKVADTTAGQWLAERWIRMLGAVVLTSFLFIPVIGIDSFAYGQFTSTTWNIIQYNIFGGSERGPDLYGTEPWHFYILNLILNFNVLVALALLSLPALVITHRVDNSRVVTMFTLPALNLNYPVDPAKIGLKKHTHQESSPFFLLAIRLAPFYLWLGVLSLQAHKEERFMFPIYPLLCFNAAVTLYLVRGWIGVVYTRFTSQYQASRSSTMRLFTTNVILAATIISFLRISALFLYYHAPMDLAFHLEHVELVRVLNATNLLPTLPPVTNPRYEKDRNIDLSAVSSLSLRLCTGKEWYRFPGHFLIPTGVEVRFIKSEFDGLLPQPFVKSNGTASVWPWDGMRVVPDGLNDLNIENSAYYVDVNTCDYLVDLDFPLHPRQSALEPRFIQDERWDKVQCWPFLDAANSPALSRILWLPGDAWWKKNEYGDYCLLRNRERSERREGPKNVLYK